MTFFAIVELTDNRLVDDGRIVIYENDDNHQTVIDVGRMPDRGVLGNGSPSRLAPHRIVTGIALLGYKLAGGTFDRARHSAHENALILQVERAS
jgi:hypothetical protein